MQFSLGFDPAKVSFVSAGLGAGASGAALFVNTNNLATGQLGLALALPCPSAFAVGTQPIVQLAFNSVSYSNTVPLVFADSPIVRQVGDITANPVSAKYLNGSLLVGGAPWPQLAVRQSGGNIVLSWPASAAGLTAQMTAALGGNWTWAAGARHQRRDDLFDAARPVNGDFLSLVPSPALIFLARHEMLAVRSARLGAGFTVAKTLKAVKIGAPTPESVKCPGQSGNNGI